MGVEGLRVGDPDQSLSASGGPRMTLVTTPDASAGAYRTAPAPFEHPPGPARATGKRPCARPKFERDGEQPG
jgi:hypothetical protein